MDPRETASPVMPTQALGANGERRPEILSYLFFAGLVATTFLF